MHEYSIVASLIDRVQQEANAHGGTRVHRLHVQIGELAGVEIDLLKTAFANEQFVMAPSSRSTRSLRHGHAPHASALSNVARSCDAKPAGGQLA